MKGRPRIALALAAGLALAAAAPANRRGQERQGDRGGDPAALLETDARFSDAAKTLGIGEAFARYADADATMMPAGAEPVTGREAIRKHFAETLAGATLSWKPFRAEVSRSGDLGYTLGNYEYRAPGAGGKAVIEYGKYCSVWKRQPDRSWRWAVDIGNGSPEPRS